jgi:predicted RNA-binding protein with PIN domain
MATASDDGGSALPPAVRARVVALAASALNRLSDAEVPSSLRSIRRFTPAKQGKLGGTALAVALETDQGFRDRVAEQVRQEYPELAAALLEGVVPPAAPLVELAALAYVLRAPGADDLRQRTEREMAEAATVGEAQEVQRLRAELERGRADARAELARLRAELTESRGEAEELRRRLRSAETALQRSNAEVVSVRAEGVRDLTAAEQTATVAAREAEAEIRRLRLRVTEAEAALSSARRSVRENRGVDSVRLRVLLDTLLAASAGLRRELDLPALVERPADAAATGSELDAAAADPLAGVFAARGQLPTDPALLDAVLAAPGLHLLVDGYNVTKTGFPDLTLESQRNRLLAGLGALASRNPGVETTCVFDGTAATTRPTAVPVPRGVRVLFSAVGELADDLLVRLVRAEPAGRPIAVVTNDREIVTAVRAAGARALASETLLARLDRA